MNKNNKYKATMLLAIFAGGYFISSAFRSNFYGGLMESICEAALVGGIADWFGVTAIFKKPFNINWPKRIFRTDILRENKEKFIFTIVDTVQNDLLSREKINNKIKNYDFFSFILNMKLINDGTLETLFSEDALQRILKKRVYENKVYVDKALSKVLESSIYDVGINAIIDKVVGILKREDSAKFISEIVDRTINRYEKDSAGRRFATKIIVSTVLKGDIKLAPYIIIDRTIQRLNDIKMNKDKYRSKIKDLILDVYEDGDEEKISSILSSVKECSIRCKNCSENCEMIDYKESENMFSKLLIRVVNSLGKEQINKYIVHIIERILDSKHKEIGELVKESLNKYNDEEIINLAYDKAGDELQLIRINGSVVGGIVGMLVFLITKILV